MQLLIILLQGANGHGNGPCPPRNPHCQPGVPIENWVVVALMVTAICIAYHYMNNKTD
jgi:hypothetical protein